MDSDTKDLDGKVDIGEISDGYHTFNQLYDFRNLLFLNLIAANPALAFKTWLNDKKERWEGWFLLGMNTEHGQITCHLPDRFWDMAAVKEIEYNFDYDGHTSDDVCERLAQFSRDVFRSRMANYGS